MSYNSVPSKDDKNIWRGPKEWYPNSEEEVEIAEKRFTNLLQKNRILYTVNQGVLSNPGRSKSQVRVFTLYLGQKYLIEKFNIIFQVQKSFYPSEKAPRGYIGLNIAPLYGIFSRSESSNTLYCAYSMEQDQMFFKPLGWMFNYLRAWKNIKKEEIKPGKKFDFQRIRIDAKPPKVPIKREQLDASVMKLTNLNNGRLDGKKLYSYSLGIDRKVNLYHEESVIITEKEINTLLSENNEYDPLWKLQFKTATNILQNLKIGYLRS